MAFKLGDKGSPNAPALAPRKTERATGGEMHAARINTIYFIISLISC